MLRFLGLRNFPKAFVFSVFQKRLAMYLFFAFFLPAVLKGYIDSP